MAYSIIINEGASEFTFESPRTRFIPAIINTFNDDNNLDRSEEVYAIPGTIRGASDAAVMASFLALRAVVQRNGAQRLRIVRDATIEIDITPAASIAGPFVRNLRVLDTGAAFANHVNFTVEVSVVTKGSEQFSDNPDVTSLQRTIITEKYNDELQRKEWRATASGDDSLALVEDFRPSGADPLREIITRELDANRNSAAYIWRAADDDSLQVQETIRRTNPGGRPINPVLVIPGLNNEEGNPPLNFRGRRRPIEIVVNGTIRSKELANVVVPTLHFDSDFLDPTRSPFDHEPKLVDVAEKIYEIAYTETYVAPDASSLGAANHSGHPDENASIEEPADGNINP